MFQQRPVQPYNLATGDVEWSMEVAGGQLPESAVSWTEGVPASRGMRHPAHRR